MTVVHIILTLSMLEGTQESLTDAVEGSKILMRLLDLRQVKMGECLQDFVQNTKAKANLISDRMQQQGGIEKFCKDLDKAMLMTAIMKVPELQEAREKRAGWGSSTVGV